MSLASYPDLSGRLAVVSGGAGGIGRAIVEACLEQGMRVAVVDVDEPAARELIEARPNASLTFHACDLRDVAAIRACAAEVTRDVGVASVIVNNAASDARHSFGSVDSSRWDDLVAVNLKHQYFLTQAFLPGLVESARASVINLSSISWRRGAAGLPVYVACKAGVEGLTRALARELGPWGIRVNAILPGMVLTERQLKLWLTPDGMAEGLAAQCLKEHVLPDDVAQAALWLASEASRMVTSQTIVVDGGWI